MLAATHTAQVVMEETARMTHQFDSMAFQRSYTVDEPAGSPVIKAHQASAPAYVSTANGYSHNNRPVPISGAGSGAFGSYAGLPRQQQQGDAGGPLGSGPLHAGHSPLQASKQGWAPSASPEPQHAAGFPKPANPWDRGSAAVAPATAAQQHQQQQAAFQLAKSTQMESIAESSAAIRAAPSSAAHMMQHEADDGMGGAQSGEGTRLTRRSAWGKFMAYEVRASCLPACLPECP